MPQLAVDPLIQRLSTILDLREKQHALTATNLANADTPGYRAQVIDFNGLLADVVDGKVGVGTSTPVRPEIHELEAPDWSTTGNSVLPEREMARLQENSTMYSALSRGLSKRLAILKYAAADGR